MVEECGRHSTFGARRWTRRPCAEGRKPNATAVIPPQGSYLIPYPLHPKPHTLYR